MRSDYALYVIAIVFFILTGVIVVAYSVAQQEQQLWIVTTAVLGLVFIGLGYTQRPKQMISTEATPTLTSPPPPTPITVKEEPRKEQLEKVTEPQTLPSGLTQVKGIKEKRAQQLKAIGINSIEDLANASTNDIAAKLQISPKIAGRWIETAKELARKP